MLNEAKTIHADKTDGVKDDAAAPSDGAAPAGLAIDNPPAAEAANQAMAETVMAEETDSFELAMGQENGNGADSEMMAPESEPALAEAALGAERSKKEKLDFRRRARIKELEQKERELARLLDDYAKLSSIHAELKDRYLRLAAEMENFRKRLERDFANRVENAVVGVLADLLPVVDDLERFLEAHKGREGDNEAKEKEYEAMVVGASLIHQNVLKILQSRGVTAMATVGREFDPNHHEAIMQMAVEDTAPNLVVQQNAKGYLLNDKVLRPAKVIVSG
jgi:molecular chaperone GrpE